jgi:hypothetical protein
VSKQRQEWTDLTRQSHLWQLEEDGWQWQDVKNNQTVMIFGQLTIGTVLIFTCSLSYPLDDVNKKI